MSAKKSFLIFFLLSFIFKASLADEILEGVEFRPIKKISFLFTPVVIPDFISAKMAFEYQLSKKFNLVVPLEAKWMDYHKALSLFNDGSWIKKIYEKDASVKPGWNIDISQLKISTGIGAKWFPFSESMMNAFFVKSSVMLGFEHFYVYADQKAQQSAIITPNLSIGYNWIKQNGFTFGFEGGGEYMIHTNPIKHIPRLLIAGFMPFLQFTIGFSR